MALPSALVDTNVLGELTRRRPNAGVLAWAATTRSIALSVVTIEEVLHSLASHPAPKLRAWFDAFLARDCEVLAVTPPIAALAGTLRGQLAARGQVRTQADVLIAATAAHHGLTVVTRRVRDFASCGVALLNPFD